MKVDARRAENQRAGRGDPNERLRLEIADRRDLEPTSRPEHATMHGILGLLFHPRERGRRHCFTITKTRMPSLDAQVWKG